MNRLLRYLFVVQLSILVGLVATGSCPALAEDLPFETISKGEFSGFVLDGNSLLSTGSAIVITNRDAWEGFWKLHVGRDLSPPAVNFGQETVVAVTLGIQGTTGGLAIEATRIEELERETRIYVLGDPRPAIGLAISNAYHIVKLRRVKGPISFVHRRLPPSFCSIEFPCHPGGRCDLVDGTCEHASLMLGTCRAWRNCPPDFEPVCGCDGVTYTNDCFRVNAEAILKHTGECP